ncbi:MAG TPA: putative collagen-binding domain-containing protein, partial [Chryseosolibacter sp.]
KELAAHWYNPKNGEIKEAGKFTKKAQQDFTPPTSGYGHDWVLIIDDLSKNYPLP